MTEAVEWNVPARLQHAEMSVPVMVQLRVQTWTPFTRHPKITLQSWNGAFTVALDTPHDDERLRDLTSMFESDALIDLILDDGRRGRCCVTRLSHDLEWARTTVCGEFVGYGTLPVAVIPEGHDR